MNHARETGVICPTCQAEIPAKARICANCGRRFEGLEPWLESDSAYWMPENRSRSRSGWKFGRSVFWFAAGLIVLGAVGVLLVAYAMARFYDSLVTEPAGLPGP